MVKALCREIELRADYLGDKQLKSIYFGGGTPSILEQADLEKVFNTLATHFNWDQEAEITLEANPDDLYLDKVYQLYNLGVNRLSIGVQSFFNSDLQWMNRAHNADEAVSAIRNAQDIGITNLTIDLIYGSPYTTHDMWAENIDIALKMGIQHISAYCLTVEERTALHHMIKTGKFKSLNSDHANEQFSYLVETLTGRGYEHYEISNYAKPGFRAVHNTNYWQGVKYLGVGPSAHSYDGHTRSWNVANNKKYIDALLSDNLSIETEFLTPAMRYNEYVMTGLRTIWGVDINHIKAIGKEFYNYFLDNIVSHMDDGMVIEEHQQYKLTHSGRFFADRIAMELFWVEE